MNPHFLHHTEQCTCGKEMQVNIETANFEVPKETWELIKSTLSLRMKKHKQGHK